MPPIEEGFENVRYSTTDAGLPFAYREGQVITTHLNRALRILREIGELRGQIDYHQIDESDIGDEEDDITEEGDEQETTGVADARDLPEEPQWTNAEKEPPPDNGQEGSDDDAEDGPFFLITGVRDPIRAVLELRLRGIVAQPNHVYFSHAGGSYPWPVASGGADLTASPVYASPVYASPVYASPVYASPVYASPVYASPVYASPVSGTDAVVHASSAVPAVKGHTTGSALTNMEKAPKHGTRIFVLDTGLATASDLPPELEGLLGAPHAIRPLRPGDASDTPTATGHHHLAPAAGHGTFIATLIDQVAPGCRVWVGKVLNNSGVGDEWAIAKRIRSIARRVEDLPRPDRSILSLSFGAPVLDHPFLLAHVISLVQSKGVVVVASAGNDAMRRPVFPAALPDVIGVGALGTSGPAPFTNHGPWVSACAPGVDLVSGFFKWSGDAQKFDGWAIWSGTSFAGPIVAGALARLMITSQQMIGKNISARDAADSLIGVPWLMSIPDLGTVVNVI